MTWFNISSIELKSHNLTIRHSNFPLLACLHILYGIVVFSFFTPKTFIYYLIVYVVLVALWQYLACWSWTTKFAIWTQKLIGDERIASQFQLFENGAISFYEKSNDSITTGELNSTSLVFWFGARMCWQEQKTKQKYAWFIFKDSMSDVDYRRLIRIMNQLKRH